MEKIIKWINDSELKNIYSYKYWNDIEKEKEKICWLYEEKDAIKLNQHLSNSGLYKEIEVIKKHIDSQKKCKVDDLACGSGWFSSILSSFENIEEVNAVEISSHRLGNFF